VSNSVASRLSSLAYFQGAAVPDIAADFRAFDLSSERGAAEALPFNIKVLPKGARNILYLHRDAGKLETESSVKLEGDDNTIVIDKDCNFHGWLNFEGSRNLVVLLGGRSHVALGATLYSADTLVTGRGFCAWGIRVWVQGGTVCTIGDECLFSENIQIRTTDHHSIIDLQTAAQTNKPADVTVGRHVWIGANCIITKGTRIGEGAIIAPAALVSGQVPRTQLWGGVPARMIRDNVSWVPSHPVADPAEIARLFDVLK
jgi:acetyltransferase-like isoleucine patch superfamily enzyme